MSDCKKWYLYKTLAHEFEAEPHDDNSDLYIRVVEATALTEAERTIAELREEVKLLTIDQYDLAEERDELREQVDRLKAEPPKFIKLAPTETVSCCMNCGGCRHEARQARAETQPGREYGLEMYAMLVKLWGQGSVDIHKGVLPFELWKELDSLLAKLDSIYSDAYCGEDETLLTSPAPETGKRDV